MQTVPAASFNGLLSKTIHFQGKQTSFWGHRSAKHLSTTVKRYYQSLETFKANRHALWGTSLQTIPAPSDKRLLSKVLY